MGDWIKGMLKSFVLGYLQDYIYGQMEDLIGFLRRKDWIDDEGRLAVSSDRMADFLKDVLKGLADVIRHGG